MALILTAYLGALLAAGAMVALAQEDVGCQTAVFVEQGGVTLIELPRQAGQRMTINPDEPLRVRVRGAPASGTAQITVLLPFGQQLTQDYNFTVAGEAEEHAVEITPADLGGLKDVVRGVFPVQVTLTSVDQAPCFSKFETRVGDEIISGPVPAATAAGTAVGVVATVAVSAWAAVGSGVVSSVASTAASSAASVATSATASAASATAGTATSAAGSAAGGGGSSGGGIRDLLNFEAETEFEIELQKRRKRGWRRFVPVPNWKRTLIGTAIGTVTGVLGSVFLQQGGLQALTTPSIVKDAFIGAGGSFGCTLVIGSVIKWIRTPKSEEEEKEEVEVEGATSVVKS